MPFVNGKYIVGQVWRAQQEEARRKEREAAESAAAQSPEPTPDEPVVRKRRRTKSAAEAIEIATGQIPAWFDEAVEQGKEQAR